LYIASSHIVQIIDTKISKSSSRLGSFIYGEDLVETTLLFHNIQVSNVPFTNIQSALVYLNFGNLTISSSRFENISSSLFRLNTMFVNLENVSINQVTCQTTSSCIIDSKFTDMKILDSKMYNIETNAELMSFHLCNKILMLNVQLENAKNLAENNSKENLYAISADRVTNLTIQNASIQEFDFSFIKGKTSNVVIMGTIFSNLGQERFFVSHTQSKETKFIVLDDSNSWMLNNLFLGNLTNNKGNGGVRI